MDCFLEARAPFGAEHTTGPQKCDAQARGYDVEHTSDSELYGGGLVPSERICPESCIPSSSLKISVRGQVLVLVLMPVLQLVVKVGSLYSTLLKI